MTAALDWSQSLGATYLRDGRCRFLVWAPNAQRVQLHFIAPMERLVPLERRERGYHEGLVQGVEPGALYFYRLEEDRERPDPASRFQPRDVHGPSEVVSTAFSWGDEAWQGLPLERYVLYELHVGTFTPEGTFEAIIPYLDYLKTLGITAIEIMPVAQFPGSRNWGYDGVFPYAVQRSYGGPAGLKRLVDSCHQLGLAVVLDVVYNHLGPEGNYLPEFGPYFTDQYRTPWGLALNFDGCHSREVRRYFLENALYWITEFHMDALRLDAVHAIYDRSARPFLQELAEVVHERARQLGHPVYVIAESDLNDARLILPPELCGFGLDAQWADDLHHSLHALLTRETSGYYRDFGRLEQLAKALREGYVYTGEYSYSRQRCHGNSPHLCRASQFVVCSQNHDQIGNRLMGERLSQMVSFESLKLAASTVLLSPYIPLLFMGEEYGETAPFPYFISHLDGQLVEAVRRGRRAEFSAFAWQGNPPDPQDSGTFSLAKLDHCLQEQGHHRTLLEFYRELIRLRRTIPPLANLSKGQMEVVTFETEQVLLVRRWDERSEVAIAFNLQEDCSRPLLPLPAGRWRKLLDSSDERWGGGGSEVPESMDSDGSLGLGIGPRAVLLFSRGSGGSGDETP